MSQFDPVLALSWPEAVTLVAILFVAGAFVFALIGTAANLHRAKLAGRQEDALRQLVQRYEHLAENTLDAQQRVATDLVELRSRTVSVEQILRTVD